MAKSLNVYITDLEKEVNLDLVPADTNNTFNTDDEIEEWNHGSQEDAGFHWNEDEERWETDSENLKWWQELAEARQKVYGYFYGIHQEDEAASHAYFDFFKWFNERERNELEDEKRAFDSIPDYECEVKFGCSVYFSVSDGSGYRFFDIYGKTIDGLNEVLRTAQGKEISFSPAEYGYTSVRRIFRNDSRVGSEVSDGIYPLVYVLKDGSERESESFYVLKTDGCFRLHERTSYIDEVFEKNRRVERDDDGWGY